MQGLWNSFGVQGTSENLVQSTAVAKQFKTAATQTSRRLACHKAGKQFKCTVWLLPVAIFSYVHMPGRNQHFPCTQQAADG